MITGFYFGFLLGLLIGCISLICYKYNLTHNQAHDKMIRVGRVIKSRSNFTQGDAKEIVKINLGEKYMTKDNQSEIQLQNRKICAIAQIKIVLQEFSFINKMNILNSVLSDMASENRMEGK